MEGGAQSIPDWRDGAAYAGLLGADRAILAWEWLRRRPDYRSAAAAGDRDPSSAGAWGLHRFEDSACAAPRARPLWTAEALDTVLAAEAATAEGDERVDLARLSTWLTRACDADAERLLISDGWRAVRLDLVAGRDLAGPLGLRFLIASPPRLAPQLLALRRLESLLRTGRFAPALHRPVPRARRHVLVLRTADALAAGAGQREIAAVLLDPDAQQRAWREDRPELRLQAQRLVRDARASKAGGYRMLLGACPRD